MNSPRKQRHLLDHDDRIRPSFMTAENVEAMLRGINTNGAGIVQLGVPHGGSGNSVFVDQELLKYDAQTGRFVSSGVVGVLPDAYSVFIPHETGVFYQSGVDPDVTDNVEVLLAEHIYTLPDVNSRWSDVDFTFQTALSDVGPSITGLQLRFGLANGDDDGMEPDTVYYPDQNTNYEAAAGTNAYVTWVARGEVPLAHATDSELRVRLYGIPNDVGSARSAISRVSSRGMVPAPPAGGQKGVPVFLDTPITLYQSANTGSGGWQTVDLSAEIPASASAAIIDVFIRMHDVAERTADVYLRARAGAVEYRIASVKSDADDETDTVVNQLLAAYDSTADVRSIQVSVVNNPSEGVHVRLLGYLT